ncbi:MAG: hypothetical protein ACLFPE_08315 [Bacteroidales bacterium]
MKSISREKFKNLAQVHEPQCISIFIPTHRVGREVNDGLDALNLKNQVKNVRQILEGMHLHNREIDSLMKPIEELVDDSSIWNHMSDGLAIFRNANHFKYYTLPVFFDEFVYVADHFYLKPLVPYLNDDMRFYLLSLSLNGAKLYEGFPHQIEEISMEDLLPENLKDTVGFDYEQKSLQFRMGQSAFGHTMYHGQGAGSEEEQKEEIMKYLRAVNDGMIKMLHDQKAPLIVAGVEYIVAMYKEANTYHFLKDEFIAGNPEQESPVLLHQKAKELLKDHFNSTRKEKLAAFEKALSDKRASYKEEEIIPAAVNQRVDTLFVKNREEMYGTFDREKNDITEDNEKTEYNAGLLNMAVIHTILNGGEVFLLEADEMPEPESKLNALFRF